MIVFASRPILSVQMISVLNPSSNFSIVIQCKLSAIISVCNKTMKSKQWTDSLSEALNFNWTMCRIIDQHCSTMKVHLIFIEDNISQQFDQFDQQLVVHRVRCIVDIFVPVLDSRLDSLIFVFISLSLNTSQFCTIITFATYGACRSNTKNAKIGELNDVNIENIKNLFETG